MERIKRVLKKRCGGIYRVLQLCYSRIRERRFCRKIKSYGEKNPDQVFYVIRNQDRKTGLMSYYNSILGHLLYAKEQRYVPVIDMCHYPNTYLDKKDLHKENSWEYYFEQPGRVCLQEVYKSRHVILSDGRASNLAAPRTLFEQYYRNPERAGKIFSIIRNDIPLKRDIKKKIEMQYRSIFPQGQKVLGVVCRGTDLLNCSLHSRQPSVEELIEIAESKCKEWDCRYIFLASDTDSAIEEFRKVFGERILTNQCRRFDDWKKQSGESDSLGDVRFSRKRDAYYRGLEYLTTLVLLSKCNFLIGTLVGSTVGAIGFNEGRYENIEIIDRGIYE